MKNKKTFILCAISILAIILIAIICIILNKNSVSEEIYNDYEYISKTINDELNVYEDENGVISQDDFQTVMNNAIDIIKQMESERKISKYSYTDGDTGIYIQLSSGVGCIFAPTVEDFMSGSGKSSVLTIEPYGLSDFWGNYLLTGLKTPKEAGKRIIDTFPDIFSESIEIDDGKDAVEALLSTSTNSIVIWFGHGAYNKDIGSALSLDTKKIDNEWIKEREKKLLNGELLLYLTESNKAYITHSFFDNLDEGCFKNNLFFLGACSTMKDNRLSDSIIKKGANAILGFNDIVRTNYLLEVLYNFFDALTIQNSGSYNTLNQAIDYVIKECGTDDNFFERPGQLTLECSSENLYELTLPEWFAEKMENNENETKADLLTKVLGSDIEADSIKYYDSTIGYDFAVIKKGEKYGLIDYSGNIVLPIEYESIFLSETAPGGDTKFFINDSNYNSYSIKKDGSIISEELGVWGSSEGADIYWYNEPVMFDYYSGKVDYSYESYASYPHNSDVLGTIISKTADVIPVQEINDFSITSTGPETSFTVDKVSEKYALLNLKTEKLITSFIYDHYGYSGFVNGILPVKKDEKWGYIDEKGKMLTEFKYDTSYTTQWNNEHMYSALNGYIIVRSGEKWGLIDVNGETVVDVKYDDISQVNPDSLVWLKLDNKWSLWKIEK